MASEEGQCIKGRVPEEDEVHPPRAAPGSRHLPWDMRSIPRKQACPPGVGGWDGESVSARAAGGDFRHGGITNATAKSRNVWGRCVAGRQPSGSGNAGPILGDASGMPRRNASDGSGRHFRSMERREAMPRRPKAPATRSRGHAAEGIPRFFVIVPVVMSPRENLLGWSLRTVATPAVWPWIRPETVNASGCGATAKRAASYAASNTKLREPNVAAGVPFRAIPRPDVLRPRTSDCRLRSQAIARRTVRG